MKRLLTVLTLLAVATSCADYELSNQDSDNRLDDDTSDASDTESSTDTDTDAPRADFWTMGGTFTVVDGLLVLEQSSLRLTTWSSEDLTEPTCVERVRIRDAEVLEPPHESVYAWWNITLGSSLLEDSADTGDTADSGDTGAEADTASDDTADSDTGTKDSGDSGTDARMAPPDTGIPGDSGADTGLPPIERETCPFLDFDTIKVGLGALDAQLYPVMTELGYDLDLPVYGLYLTLEGEERLYVYGMGGTDEALEGDGEAPSAEDPVSGELKLVPLYLFEN